MPTSTIIERGGPFRIDAWVTKEGTCPLLEFLKELSKDRPDAMTAFRVAVEKIHIGGGLPGSTEKVRLLNPKQEGIWELKIHKGPGYRFYFFRDGPNRIVLTHGRKKPKDS
ncbi:MAG: type II toxin-antitoxin system RelE/ParE family toxin [Candidatus Omnitrophica bacterium]|nr:type II toxin-antitoxin system RelE/ParE family toxin [Candidatus Omnitrophota bacterium]